jgi:hypothetical protein
MSSRRLNARLDSDLAMKLQYIKRRTGHSDTEVVKRSLELYYDEVRRDGLTTQAALSDFVGCESGDPELSSRYKEALPSSLERKL